MVRTRFAPSPTGFLHIGGLRTAAYSYAAAKHQGGEFLLRIEDTDQAREVPQAAAKLQETLHLFGLDWDQSPVIQSQRAQTGVYRDAASKLIASGHAFYCQCQGRNAKTEGFSQQLRDPCRDLKLTSGAVKIKIPPGEVISYHDYVQNKDISWSSDTVPDAVLLKSEQHAFLPTYHLAAAVDDLASGITLVLRGHDWQPSTPIHLYVYRFLSATPPQIGHLTDILDPEGGKLSKRKGNVTCEQFLQAGYLPEALLNFVLLLGWAPKDNRELYTLSEFVSAFDPAGFQKANPVFHTEKLDWMNGQYLRSKSDTELTQLVKPFVKTDVSDTKLTQIIQLSKERLKKLTDIQDILAYVSQAPATYDQTAFTPYALPSLASMAQVIESDPFTDPDAVNQKFKQEISRLGVKTGDYYMDLRVALTGSQFTPPITNVGTAILGKDETLNRINAAQQYLKSKS